MSEAKPEDRFDALERRYEERQRAATDLAGMLGLDKGSGEGSTDAGTEDQARDEAGRFVGSVDAGERGAPVLPTPSMGHMIMSILEDDPSYLDG